MWLYVDLQASTSASLSTCVPEISICPTRTSSSSSCEHPSTTGTVCVLFSQSSSRLHNCCVGGTWFFWSPCQHSVRGTGAATLRLLPTLCRALFPRASVHLDRAPWPCSAVEFAWLARPFPSRLLRVARARLRLVTPAVVAASLTRWLVVGGHHSTISAFS